MARVSIIVRTKDRPTFLARALGDVVGQSFADWHMVIVNDGGNPAVVDAVVADLADQLGDRCTVVNLAESSGRPAAANRGFEHAVGEYVVVHDDDDLWHPDFLRRTVDYLDEHSLAVAVAVPTEIVIERPEGEAFVEVERRPFAPPGDIVSLMDLIVINRVVPISMLIRRTIMEALGAWDETLLCVEDWEFNLRLATEGPIGYLRGEALAFWMQRPSMQDGPDANSMFTSTDQHFEFDRLVRDRALREGDRHHDIGHLLYLSKFIDERVRNAENRMLRQMESVRNDLRRDVEYYSFGATVRRAARRLRRRRS